MECAGIVRRRQHVKRNVLRQSACGMKVQARPIKSVRSDLRFHLAANAARVVDSYAIYALTMPGWRDAEGHRPIRSLLKDRSVPIVHHLVAVVFELLAERT